MARGKLYIVLFATAVCGVFSVVVSLAAVTLKDKQDANRKLDRQGNVLRVAGLLDGETKLTVTLADDLFKSSIEALLIDLEKGTVLVSDQKEALAYDQRRALGDPSQSRKAPANKAKVQRLPNKAVVYLVKKDGQVDSVVLPVEGKGLWSTMYGYLALESDLKTVKGVTFYEHGETPGLGGEIDNQRWKDSWVGKVLFDAQGKPVFHLKKGLSGDDVHAVDGLSGATLTSNGVTDLVQFWTGTNGYGPYIEQLSSSLTGGR
jgi:Na+-transporting NADH:ubiquinone oxidoreductase subunit C